METFRFSSFGRNVPFEFHEAPGYSSTFYLGSHSRQTRSNGPKRSQSIGSELRGCSEVSKGGEIANSGWYSEESREDKERGVPNVWCYVSCRRGGI